MGPGFSKQMEHAESHTHCCCNNKVVTAIAIACTVWCGHLVTTVLRLDIKH